MRLRAVALVVALLLVLLASTGQAYAHASLVKAEPADGAVVAQAPAVLRLTFNEPVSPLVMRLIGPGGEPVALGDVVAENAGVSIATPAGLRSGTHVLSWRVISADGHPVAGSLIFSIGAPSARPTADLPGDAAVRTALWAAKIVIYVGLFIGIGGVFFRAWIGDPAVPALGTALVAALVVGLVAVPVSVGLQGLDALELAFPDLLTKHTWETGLETSYGLTAIVAAFAMFAALFAAAARSAVAARGLSLAALLGVGVALSLSGHAATAAPRLLMAPAVFLHGVCVAFWLGSLLPLLLMARHAGAAAPALTRFSRVIPYPLTLLIVTGGVLAIVQLGRLDALWSTSYGIVLACKLAAVAALLAFAALNRYVLVPRFAAAKGGAARPLARSIACEIALALAILALVSAWRFTPPPRSLIATPPVSVHLHGDKAMAQIEMVPEEGRGARVNVLVLDGEFRPLVAKEVTLVLSSAAAGIEPLRRVAARAGDSAADATWRIEDLRIPVAGPWLLRVEILVSDFDKVTLEQTVTLPRTP